MGAGDLRRGRDVGRRGKGGLDRGVSVMLFPFFLLFKDGRW